MKTLRNIYRSIKAVFRIIIRFLDKKIVVPITKFFLFIYEKTDKNSRTFERWLTKKNTMTFLSLLLALSFFFLIDSKSLILVESNAAVLYNQKVEATYNSEAYVVEGLPETVDVVLIGKKYDLYLSKQLSTKNVTVDLSGLKPGKHNVELKYENDVRTIDYKLDPSSANIYIYPKLSETRTVNIDILNQDKLDTKLSVNSVEIDQKEIIIKGAEHTLNDVATVKALVDINQITDPTVGISTISDVTLVAYNSEGQVVNVEMVPNKVTANVSVISPSKEVPIKVIPTGNVEFGLAISSITSSITKVKVYGNEDVINNIQYVPVEIDVTDLNEAKTYNVILTKPSGIRYISENTSTVKVTLNTEVTKEITGVQIEHVKLDSNYKVIAINNTSSQTTVIVKGTKEVLETIDSSAIKATIDLSGYGIGEHEVTVNVFGDEVKAKYTSKTTKVKIKIMNK